MITVCKFDKLKDFQEVVPDLAISITEAITTGTIKDTIDTTPYSKINDIKEVGSYLHDSIDIALAADRIGQHLSTMPVAGNNKEEK